MAACAEAFTDSIREIRLTIDGVEVEILDQYRTQSPAFPMVFPEGNFFGVPPGLGLSVADGYDIIIAPPPGEYLITGSTWFEGEDAPLSATFTIVVQEPMVIKPAASPVASPVTTG